MLFERRKYFPIIVEEEEGRPLSLRRAFLLAYLGINSVWKSISEKRQCSAKNRHNTQHNKHKSIRCATKRMKVRPAASTARLCLMHAKSEAYGNDTGTIYYT